jgi:hypothetical protein
MPRLEARLGSLGSRNRGLEIGHFPVFRFAGRACVRAEQHRRRLARGQAVCVGGGISIRRAQDRQPVANRSYYRNYLAPRLREGQSCEARRECSLRKRRPDARFHRHLWRVLSRFPSNDCACPPKQRRAMSHLIFPPSPCRVCVSRCVDLRDGGCYVASSAFHESELQKYS